MSTSSDDCKRVESPAPDLEAELYEMQYEILGSEMSERSDESPERNFAPEIYEMEYEILESDFKSDDLGTYQKSLLDPLNPSELTLFYEGAGAEIISTPPSNMDLEVRQLPTDYSSSPCSEPTNSRKRKRDPTKWKQNIRKSLCQRGLPFTDSKGIKRPGKAVGPKCAPSCFYLCGNIQNDKRLQIHEAFWRMSPEEKKIFYGNFVKTTNFKRRRPNMDNSRKQSGFQYYLKINERTVQVCKKYFLNTLAISEKTIYYFFAKYYHQDTKPSLAKLSYRGKKNTSDSQRQEVKDHISSFPVVESHYCRSTTSRKYLEAHLSVQQMYELYKTRSINPVGAWTYRNIFNTNFNYGFHKPKKDVCDKCSFFKAQSGKCSQPEMQLYQKHIEEKNFTKAERDTDVQQVDLNVEVLLYDLQNVITLPKMYVSNFYYKRKLSVYNLTATVIVPGHEKKTYCAIWNETRSGRSGNDIASALYKILDKILSDLPNIVEFVLWSDSCVPQNKNQITSTALLQFLYNHPQVNRIQQKFGEPGHSCLQEVDCVHSVIEKYLRNVEIPSQISLIRLLKNARFPNVHLKILQMNELDFKCFSKKSSKLHFEDIQFFKCKTLMYEKRDLFRVARKLSFKNISYDYIEIKKTKGRFTNLSKLWEEELSLPPRKNIDEQKRKDLSSMIIFLEDETDKEFYRVVLKK